MAEVERELNEAQVKVEGAQATFDTIAARMASELARFQVREPPMPGLYEYQHFVASTPLLAVPLSEQSC